MELWPTRGRESQGGTWFTNIGEASTPEPCTRSTWKAISLSTDQCCSRALRGRGTTMTGRSALRSVALTTLPRRISRTAERPREPMTITAAFRSPAHAISGSAMARA